MGREAGCGHGSEAWKAVGLWASLEPWGGQASIQVRGESLRSMCPNPEGMGRPEKGCRVLRQEGPAGLEQE